MLLEALTGEVAFPGALEASGRHGWTTTRRSRQGSRSRSPIVLRRMTALLPEDRPDLEHIALAFQNAFVQDLVSAGRVDPKLLATDEERRLAAVRRYDILDTPPDDAFDRVTALACRLLEVPIALISIVDGDREWFKSSRGVDIDQVDRDIALCASTVATGRPLRVDDIHRAHAFVGNPIVLEHPELRAFASVPLTTHDGHAIGTLCVFDGRQRAFSDEELDDLAMLAAVAMRELDLRLASRRALFRG